MHYMWRYMWRCRDTRVRDAGHEYFTVSTSVQWCTGTVIASIYVGAISSILACAWLTTFIYIACAVLPSPTINTDAAVSVDSVHTLTIILARYISCAVVNVSTGWTSVVVSTVAGKAIPCVYADTSIQARLGGTEINVFTTGGPCPPGSTIAGECFNVNDHNIRAMPTIWARRRAAGLCKVGEHAVFTARMEWI